MLKKTKFLYHGSEYLIEGYLKPVIEKKTFDHVHSRPAIFATERIDIAALFMFPMDTLASIGFEDNIAYICIWGTAEEFKNKDLGGFIYVLPGDSFKKIGKQYEWQSFEPVLPIEIKKFRSVVEGMIECGAWVYFINDNDIFDQIRYNKDSRMLILKQFTSENERLQSLAGKS